MTKNVGGTDRSVRIALGVVLIAIAVMGISSWGWIGVVPLVTGLIGWCPPYAIFSMSTCKTKTS